MVIFSAGAFASLLLIRTSDLCLYLGPSNLSPSKTPHPYLTNKCFTVCGGAVASTHYWTNGYKRDRFRVDQWDRQHFERDYRLTGQYRGQSDNVEAPSSFATNGFRKLQPVPKWW